MLSIVYPVRTFPWYVSPESTRGVRRHMGEQHWSSFCEQIIAQTRIWDAKLQWRKKQFQYVVVKICKGRQESLPSARSLAEIISGVATKPNGLGRAPRSQQRSLSTCTAGVNHRKPSVEECLR